jgi:uncharacterized membrane protein (UPF0127 family)
MSTSKSGFSKYLIIGLLLLVMIGFVITSIPKGKDNRPANIDVAPTVQKDVKFKKEGTIEILRMSGEHVIKLDIEIAETDEERAQGLMYRQSMGGTQGMLFIFETERPQSFWMKNTYIPLDIIFIDKDFRIVDQYLGADPKSNKSIRSRRPATYVLEVNAGFCRAYNTGPGMTVKMERD